MRKVREYQLRSGTYNCDDYKIRTRKTLKGFIKLLKDYGFQDGDDFHQGEEFNDAGGSRYKIFIDYI